MWPSGIPGKTRQPELPSAYLARGRLDDAWRSWERCRVVLIDAPAGYGKTTLIAANVARSARRVFWYTFDALDSDLVGFVASFSAALGVPAPATGGDGAARHLLAAWLPLLQAEPAGWNVVLDDLHALRRAPEVIEFLGHFAAHVPAGCTLFLATRETVGLRSSRLRTLGAAASVGLRELQFTPAETAAFYRHALPHRPATAAELDGVATRTEGWAAGLGMCLQYVEATPGRTLAQALTRFDAAGPDWFVYFAEEVLNTLEPALQEFLLRASVLPRLEPALCDAVLGIGESRAFLATLHQRNLFTFPLAGEGEAYRFHQLFADFLRRRREQKLPAGELARLQRRAAKQLCLAREWLDAAVAYREAGAVADAVALLEAHGAELLGAGLNGRVLRMFESLPQPAWQRRSGALLVLGNAAEGQGRWDEALGWYRQALRLRPPVRLRAQIEAMVAVLHDRRGEHAACVRLCRRVLATRGWRDRTTWARLVSLLAVSAAELGRYDEAERHLSHAIAVLARARDARGEGFMQYLIAINVHSPRGDVRAAREAARRALVLYQREQDPRRTCHTLGVLAFVLASGGEEAEAREAAEEGLRRTLALGDRAMEPFCLLTLGRCALLRRELDLAEEQLQTTLGLAAPLRETDLATYPHLGLAEVALHRGNRHAARRSAGEALRFALRTHDPLQAAQARMLIGWAWQGRSVTAMRAAWRTAERSLRAIGARFELHRLLVMRLAAGDVPAARVPGVLRELLAGVAELRQEPLLLAVERERAPRVLGLALAHGVEPEYTGTLLVRLGEDAVPELARSAALPGLAERCAALLGQIGGEAAQRALAPLRDPTTRAGRVAQRAWEELGRAPEEPLRIRMFGTLRVTVGERVIPPAAWQSQRALRLFVVLALRRFRWVATDELIEALWPGAEPGKGRNSLVQSVYLLRRTLQPGRGQARLSPYVLSRRDACRLEPGTDAPFDVVQFEEALARAQGAERSGRQEDAEQALREAVALHEGDLLAELPYDEAVVEERERLRERLLGALTRLLELVAGGKRWAELAALARDALARDPHREAFHAALVTGLLANGRRADATAAWHRYEQLVRGELGEEPSPRMRSLAERLQREV